MKVAPYAVLGAAALSGWVSSSAVAFASREQAERAAEHVSCAHTNQALKTVSLAHQEGEHAHQHGPSCGCAACVAKLPASQ